MFLWPVTLYLHFVLVAGHQYNVYSSPLEIMAGNDALLACSIPSFVVDFVSVTSWVDAEGNEFFPGAAGKRRCLHKSCAWFWFEC